MTTDLAAALNDVKKKPRGVDELLASLPPKEAKAFDAALRDPDRVSLTALSEIMTSHGHAVSFNTIKRWRTKNLKAAK